MANANSITNEFGMRKGNRKIKTGKTIMYKYGKSSYPKPMCWNTKPCNRAKPKKRYTLARTVLFIF